MNKIAQLGLLFFCLITFSFVFSQRGKDGDFTVSSTDEILNTFTRLATSVENNENTIEVTAVSDLNGAQFSSPLEPGDLLLIYQVQGVNVDVNKYQFDAGWGNANAVQSSYFENGNLRSFIEFGEVLEYKNAGNYEYVEVLEVNGNEILLTCNLTRKFTDEDRFITQVVRVPRFENLTIESTGSITTAAWDGSVGGVLAVEVKEDFHLEGEIDVSAMGFRGGEYENDEDAYAADAPDAIDNINGRGFLGTDNLHEGAQKGEGILGFDYYTYLHSNYGYGAIANGGGGGGYHNAGGGGGSNVGEGDYFGYGVPNGSQGDYITAWSLEDPDMVNNPSAGGGRGGYSAVASEENPLTDPPSSAVWQGDFRRIAGGVGGHPLAYPSDINERKVFMGGGGGAGNGNDGYGTSGANGGGVVFLALYGEISGNGKILANGGTAESTESGTPSVNGKNGDDGAGGGGAGGSIVIQNTENVPNSIELEAIGGNGGDNFIQYGPGFLFTHNKRADGPGGGGAGGLISFSSGNPQQNVSGGVAGECNSVMEDFPMNGATDGASGLNDKETPFFDILVENDTICYGEDITIQFQEVGNSIPNGTYFWTPEYSSNESDKTYFTGELGFENLTEDLTIYIGICSSPFRVPVTIVVAAKIELEGTEIISHETCDGNDGAITGLSATGGLGDLTYEWNGETSDAIELDEATSGDYTLTITDEAGCEITSGPYTIQSASSIEIDISDLTLTNESCDGNDGAIEGIQVSGGEQPYVYNWNEGESSTLDLTNAVSGEHVLVVTDANDCSKSVMIEIEQDSDLELDETDAIVVNASCNQDNGGVTGIQVSGGETPYSFEWSENGGDDLDLSDAPEGDYQLTVTDDSGCSITSSVYEIKSENGPVILDDNVVITPESCDGNDGAITGIEIEDGTEPYAYEWNNNGGNGLDLANATEGNYTLTVTDDNGCEATHDFEVEGSTPINIDISTVSIQHVSCAGNDGEISGIEISGGEGTLDYQWSGTNQTTLDISNLTAGNYELTVTDDQNCTATAGPIVVNQTGGPEIDESNLQLVDASCDAADGSITGITATGNNLTFSWSPTGGNQLDASHLASGSYTLTVTDENGCETTGGPYILGENAGPIIDDSQVNIENETCEENDGSISGISVSGGQAPYSYQWTGTSQNSIDLQNLSAGNYSVEIADQNGCTASAGPFNVGAPVLPTIDILTPNQSIGEGESVQIETSYSPSSANVSWSPGENISCLNCDNPVVSPDESTTYTVTLTTEDGCTAQASIYITVENPCPEIWIPTIFSPNNDGKNDKFCVEGGCIKSINMQIFNRWGETVFESNNQHECWDGKMNGVKLNSGVYTYLITGMKANGKTFTFSGMVNMVR